MKPVGIIILNWNGAALLRRYLPSVVADNSNDIADVVVVDNGSTDESLSVLKQEFPDCALGLSVGERTKKSYYRLHQAGAQRYFLSFVTSDPLHFTRLHPPTHSLSNKIDCINDLKDLGYETDTGFLAGAPYEQVDYLVKDLTCLLYTSDAADE